MGEGSARTRFGRLLRLGEMGLLLVLGMVTTLTAMTVGWLGLRGRSCDDVIPYDVSAREHARMKVVSAHARDFQLLFGFAPLSVQELVVATALDPAMAFDRWQHPYRIRQCGQVLYAFDCETGQALISSNGPDGLEDTADDLLGFTRGGD